MRRGRGNVAGRGPAGCGAVDPAQEQQQQWRWAAATVALGSSCGGRRAAVVFIRRRRWHSEFATGACGDSQRFEVGQEGELVIRDERYLIIVEAPLVGIFIN